MLLYALIAAFLVSLTLGRVDSTIPINRLILPEGFAIEVLADSSSHGLAEPRALQVQQYKGATLIYVGTLELSCILFVQQIYIQEETTNIHR